MAIAIAYVVWGNLLDSPEHKLKRRFLFFHAWYYNFYSLWLLEYYLRIIISPSSITSYRNQCNFIYLYTYIVSIK